MIFRRSTESMSDRERCEQIEAMYQKSRRGFPEVAEITTETLRERLGEEGVVVVDVREPEEQAVSMIDGAIPVHEFEAHRDDHAGATIVTYCTVGHRSGNYAKKLHAEGWKVLNLKGAILAWTHMGGALRDADGPSKRVHVWGPKANLVAEGYEPVW